MNGRLLRSRRERMIGGVAGGIGQQLGVDPTWVRIAWVILAIATNGAAILVYLLLLFVIPEEGTDAASPAPDAPRVDPLRPAVRRPINLSLEPGNGALVVGGILVVVGAWALVAQYMPDIPWSRIWPIGLLVAGLVLVVASFNRGR
jgi:phage shock protein C